VDNLKPVRLAGHWGWCRVARHVNDGGFKVKPSVNYAEMKYYSNIEKYIECFMRFKRGWIGLVVFFLASCAAENDYLIGGNGPLIGMRFWQPYSAAFGGGNHNGLDLDVPLGSPVRSIADGVVIKSFTGNSSSSELKANTNSLLIKHDDGVISSYTHIGKITVKRGDSVVKGQQVAVIELNGTAGVNTNQRVTYPHLHLEVFKRNELIDPESLKMSCEDGVWMWPVGCRMKK
jgi:murein DD-endopeptidase MepM/ murein hydrolase activator NlpD